MTTTAKQFILVDDDAINNFLSKMVIQKTIVDVEVKDFLIPELALSYIKTEFEIKPLEEKTTLLIDINMPTLTGWEFLDVFETFSEPIKNHFDIYILSSSVNPKDIQQAKHNPLVIDIIEKPLSKELVAKMFEGG